MPIRSRPDHVAVAVPKVQWAATRWHDALGGGYLEPRVVTEAAGFATCQLLYRNDVKLELLEPTRNNGFAGRFVRRFGARIHHMTLTVPELMPAVEAVRRAGYDVVDVATDNDLWHEAFLRPTQAGGLIVQLAWSRYTMWEWADHWNARTGWQVEDPREDGAKLLGPSLGHDDLDMAARLWSTLGATVSRRSSDLSATWPGTGLSVHVVERTDDAPGPIGLRFEHAPPFPADRTLGPAVLPEPPPTLRS